MKYIHIYMSGDCSWHGHIEHIKANVWHKIHVVRRQKFILDRKSQHFFFIRPLLEYTDVVWDICSKYDTNELEKPNEATRNVTGATKLVSINAFLTETR